MCVFETKKADYPAFRAVVPHLDIYAVKAFKRRRNFIGPFYKDNRLRPDKLFKAKSLKFGD